MPKAPDYPLVRFGAAKVLIAGGGKVALQKARGIPRAWSITVISPSLLAPLKPRVRWIKRKARAADVDHFDLVFAASSDPAANAALAKRALAKGKLVSVADQPERGNFRVPAVARAGKLSATVSTSGASPALAKALRIWLEGRLAKPELQKLALSLGRRRAALKQDPQAKDAALEKLKRPDFLQRMLR